MYESDSSKQIKVISDITIWPKYDLDLDDLLFSSPSSVHRLDWLHGKSGGHQVIGVVPAPAHHEEALDLPHHKDQAALHKGGGTQRGSLYSKCTEPFKDRGGRMAYGRAPVTTDTVMILTGPTNPRSPERTNGISPMGTPLALTGIT